MDPRPQLVTAATGFVLTGSRCTACRHPAPVTRPRCSRCGAETEPASFDTLGTVVAATTVRITVGDRQPGYHLAYVDLVDGPRVLTHVSDEVEVGSTFRLVSTTPDGDLLAAAEPINGMPS